MTPPPLVDAALFSSPVTFEATTAGIYTAVRLPTLEEARSRRRSKQECACSDGTCLRCELDDDDAFKESQDV